MRKIATTKTFSPLQAPSNRGPNAKCAHCGEFADELDSFNYGEFVCKACHDANGCPFGEEATQAFHDAEREAEREQEMLDDNEDGAFF